MNDLNEIIARAVEISRDVVAKEAFSSDQNATWVSKSMRALKDARLTGLVVPVELNGMGQGMFAVARVCEELGKSYGSAGLCFGMHCVGTSVIAAKATKFQKDNYLVPVAEGKHITSVALSEPGTGAHFYFPQTTLKFDNADIILDGTKSFVTNGPYADSHVVSAAGINDRKNPEHFSCVIVDSDTKDVEWGQNWSGLGMRGNASCAMHLKSARVDKRKILGEEGDQLWYVFNVVIPYLLVSLSGTFLGIAQAALDQTKSYLMKRHYTHNGLRLSQNALLQHRLGCMWTNVESARRMIYNGAIAADNMETGALTAVFAAKAEVARCVSTVATEAMALCGGSGYHDNNLLGILLRDAAAAHIISPTTDLLYSWIGRTLLDQPILSD